MAGTKHWPGFTGKTFPDVYNKIPSSVSTEKKPGQLTDEQLQQYFDVGYVQVDDFFTAAELDQVSKEIEGLVEQIAQKLHNGGKIKQLYSEYDFNNRLTMMEKDFPGANVLLHKLGQLTGGIQKLWCDERLLNINEQLLGTQDIVGHPVWNLRCNTPQNNAATVPWHQDAGYLGVDSYDTQQVTAWIPLVDADAENGCLQFVRRGQKKGLVAPHTCAWKDTWYIMLGEEEMEKTLGVNMKEDIVTLPVKRGGILLFSNMIPHRSLNNNSKGIRWSLDLRWQREDKPLGFPMSGIKMRSADPSFKVDWDAFARNIRNEATLESMKLEVQDPFDTIITGPWLQKWEVTNSNRHVERAYKNPEGAGVVP